MLNKYHVMVRTANGCERWGTSDLSEALDLAKSAETLPDFLRWVIKGDCMRLSSNPSISTYKKKYALSR